MAQGGSNTTRAPFAAPAYVNRLPNGDFARWRRGTSFPALGNGTTFFADDWAWVAATTGSVTIIQDTSVPAVGSTSINAAFCAKLTVQTAPTVGSSDNYSMQTRILGYDYRALTNGFAGSFWVKAHRIGTYSLGFRNFNSDRFYTIDYAVNVADTWEYKTFTVPTPPTAGSWNYDAGTGLIVTACLAAGATLLTAPSLWTTGSFRGSTNQINGLAATTDVFALALLNIIPGATPQPCIPHPYSIQQGWLDAPTPTTQAFGDAADAGASQVSSLADHKHAWPSFGAASGLLLKSTAANGSGASPLRADASIKAFDTTDPTTQAFGDVAAVGSVDFAARRDHKHGMPLVTAASLPVFPAARVYNSGGAVSIADSTVTAVAWPTEDFDTDTMHDTATFNSRLTIKTAGRYIFGGAVMWFPNATGLRSGWILLNGTAVRLVQKDSPGFASAYLTLDLVTVPLALAVNDYVEFIVYQTSGGSLSINNGPNASDVFWAVRLGS